MKRYISVIVVITILSFYFFPFQFRNIPFVNSKMILAGIGLPIVMLVLGKSRNAMINKEFFFLSLIAALVSLIGYISVVYNETLDYTYATYIVSMWVWVCAAYVVVSLMRFVHGHVSVFLICNYLIALCVAQCILALTMEFYTPLRVFVYSIIDEATVNFMEDKDRLMGIGCGLDVAGSRFSAILVMIVHVCIRFQSKVLKYLYLYIFAFIIISVIGNMIARTTTVGMIVAICYFVISFKSHMSIDLKKGFLFWTIILMLIFLPCIVYAYNNIPDIYRNIRFCFEGFFSIIEKGVWEVGSNEKLQSMYDVFPTSFKTWLIGDGYFGTTTTDPYYIGKEWKGFYMATDVGYLRFIFYFGILGLLAFAYFMYRVARTCMNAFPLHKMLFLLLLMVNFIVWFKVSTDIFLVFAPFLCLGKEENDAFERQLF